MNSTQEHHHPLNRSTADFFSTAFQNSPLKTTAIVTSLISVIFLISSGYGIIWYERYGSDSKRILINRLVTSICWTGIEFYVLVLPMEIARYIFGPLPETLCMFHLMLKNIITFQTVLFCDGVSAARYLFIFYLKNPSEFQDEFWHIFINIWIVFFGLLSQFVFVYLPGRQPLNFYICTGLDPHIAEADLAVKKNFVFNVILLLSIFLQAKVAHKFITHRMKMDSLSSYAYIDNFRKENFYDFLICLTFLAITVIYGYLLVSINYLEPALLNDYPNYLLMYALNFGFPLFSCSAFSVLFYAKNHHMRSTLWEELQEIIGKQ